MAQAVPDEFEDTDLSPSKQTEGLIPPSDNSKKKPELKKQDSKLAEFGSKVKSFGITVKDATKERLSLIGQLKQAKSSLEQFINPKIFNKKINEDTLIPKLVLKKAKGIVFLTVIKAGFLFAGNIGTGIVIVRQVNGGWSPPSSIGTTSVSFGALVGASKVDYIMILPNDNAVKQFTGKGQLRFGGELQVALGPLGRDLSGSAGIGDKGASVIYSYSHAKGLYGGIGIDAKGIFVRPECNKDFYKRKVSCLEILSGNVEMPENDDYNMIIHLLDSYCETENDLSPGIDQQKLTLDDVNDVDNDEIKENNNNNNNNNKNGNNNVGQKISQGFNSFRKSVSKKFNDLSNKKKDNKNNDDSNDNNPGNNSNNIQDQFDQ